MDFGTIISLILSGIAILVSLWVWLKNYRLDKRLFHIEEARENDRIQDRKSALISATGRSKEKTRMVAGDLKISQEYYIEIRNDGQGEARIRIIELDDAPAVKHPSYVAKMNPFVDYIASNSKVDLLLIINSEAPFPQTIKIIYDDDSGVEHQYRNPITFR